MAAMGLDPLPFLETNDALRRVVLQSIAHHALELRRKLDDEHATKIANAVGKMLGG
jgi:hypothetical protein